MLHVFGLPSSLSKWPSRAVTTFGFSIIPPASTVPASCRTRVSWESLYGTWGRCSARASITLPGKLCACVLRLFMPTGFAAEKNLKRTSGTIRIGEEQLLSYMMPLNLTLRLFEQSLCTLLKTFLLSYPPHSATCMTSNRFDVHTVDASECYLHTYMIINKQHIRHQHARLCSCLSWFVLLAIDCSPLGSRVHFDPPHYQFVRAATTRGE